MKNLIYTVYAGTPDNVVAAFANNIDRDMYLDDLREAYPDTKQGHFDGSTIVPQSTDINTAMYEALELYATAMKLLEDIELPLGAAMVLKKASDAGNKALAEAKGE